MSRRIRLSIDSRYHHTLLYQLKEGPTLTNTYAWGMWKPPEFPPSEHDEFHRVRDYDVGRLDLLSQQFYATPDFWWVIAWVNNIFDPLTMEEGMTLRVPPRELVYSVQLSAESPRTSDVGS